MNAALGQTPLSSPLESPDVMQLLLPISDIGATATSMASIKLSSVDSLPMTATAIAAPKTNQVNQVRPIRNSSSSSCTTQLCNTTTTTNNYYYRPSSTIPTTNTSTTNTNTTNTPFISHLNNSRPLSALCHPMAPTHASNSSNSSRVGNAQDFSPHHQSTPPPRKSSASKSLSAIPETITDRRIEVMLAATQSAKYIVPKLAVDRPPPPLEFSLSSVGRSFFLEEDVDDLAAEEPPFTLHTPDTPSANVTPSSSSHRFSSEHDYFGGHHVDDDEQEFEAQRNNLKMLFDRKSKMRQESYCGSWDLLEIDLDFHEVNLDPSYVGDVQEYIFFGDDDPFGVLPPAPTQPDSLHL